MKKLKSRNSALLWLFLIIAILGLSQMPAVYGFPTQLRMIPGQTFDVNLGPLWTVSERQPSGLLARADSGTATLEAGELGNYGLELKLLGLIPVRRWQVEVVPQLSVIPGGQAIGVLLSPQGLIVRRTMTLVNTDGQEISPASQGGLRQGDVIVRVGTQDIHHFRQLEAVVQMYGRRNESLPVVIRREGKNLQRRITPALVAGPGQTTRYRIGVQTEDPAAGVGTLTFWEPGSMKYGALGHQITDVATHQPVSVMEGRIVPALIQGIDPGQRGRPGEKLGVFDDTQGVLGQIEKNTVFGIYGRLSRTPSLGKSEAIPVALAHEVHQGPAYILTVLDGDIIQRFAVDIINVNRQSRPDGKGLIIRVVDPSLLQRTRGIVQGMSGSPIIQDGRFVGAVTHVFVNDPTRGYGILAEWMVYEADIFPARTHDDQQVRLDPASGF